ncbi:MAG TPA: hypothetical protein DIW43_07305 [Spongiibacteraceae bacterium]|nr:hypothetical protein [Spongiibacteraceae bacterium]HCS27244.1 hypothetical protein [Spongiibacteraceae bacterium]
MGHILRGLTLCVAVTVLTACGSAPSNSGLQEAFSTRIYPNDSKVFRYEFSRGDKTQPLVPYDQSGGFTDGRRVYSAAELRKKNERALQSGAERKLLETGYCREGFFVLDTLISYSGASLRGECKEAASDADRTRFNPETGNL